MKIKIDYKEISRNKKRLVLEESIEYVPDERMERTLKDLCEPAKNITRFIIDTREKVFREKLLSLGWRPPIDG